MSFDKSRFTFNPRKDYSGVVMQQGRVQLDSDWNEWLAELTRRTQAGTLDILGRAVYPPTTPFAFHITASSSGGTNALKIGPGRLYVDGLPAENHGDPATVRWDPALAEMSNTPQPPPGTETGTIDFTKQPYMPPGTKLPAGNGPFLAYLDVWVRPVDYLNDPDLIDKAVGVDSTGRLQTVWQVRLFDLANSPGATCDSPISNWPPAPSAGLLTTGTTPTAPSGPCCLTSGAAYTGQENQFYRVQIHQPGAASAVPPTTAPTGATFKWSRDNGSVITGVTAINNVTNSAGNPASQLTVLSLGRDRVLGFAPGHWIEILDDSFEFDQISGELHQIDTIDFASKTVTLATTLGPSFTTGATDPARHTRIRRWDQSGKVFEQDGTTVWSDIDAEGRGDIPVPPAGTSLILENGITVSFDVIPATGHFVAGDFWSFAARTADGSVEKLDKAAPRGIHHHYARLSIVTFPSSATDCRTKWPPSAGESECGCCCTVTVGDGVESIGKFISIQQAINSLPAQGGEVCILPGRYFENILISDRRDVVLRGCGWQTRIASGSLKPQPPPPAPAAAGTVPPVKAGAAAAPGKFAAVISVASSQHVQMLSFAVEAAKDEVGILLDGTSKLVAQAQSSTGEQPVFGIAAVKTFVGVIDVTLDDLVLTASTLPAVLACQVRLLEMRANRIAMQDVLSQWPAAWVSGVEIRLLRNWVGIQNADTKLVWLPLTVAADLSADAAGSATGGAMVNIAGLHPGGIQIAGPARDVLVQENEIEGGSRNGITLGSMLLLDANGKDTGVIIGVLALPEDPCRPGGTLQIPIEIPGFPGSRFVAGGKLINIQIDHNRICDMGLCGIGPVGFFDLLQELEVISIENLTISSNTIARTLLRDLAAVPQQAAVIIGYGAICVPDVANLIIRDNTISDFGSQPGVDVCGIFLLHAEMSDISGNHVLETRDWKQALQKAQGSGGGSHGGIVVIMATPPSFPSPVDSSLWSDKASLSSAAASPVYEPGLPALRVHNNVVRVPLGETLSVVGVGPFSFRGNEFSCGGTVIAEGRPAASTVLILNMGTAIEAAATKFSKLQAKSPAYSSVGDVGFNNSSSGAVLFTSNICQLEARASKQKAFSSVSILSLDSLIFSDNLCWVDGPFITAFLDVLLAAGTLQLTGNRFQEGPGFPVIASGLCIGNINIAAQNLSTYCLFNRGTLSLIDVNNVAIIGLSSQGFCAEMAKNLHL